MKLPLANKLKKRLHLQMASLQDEVASIIYELEQGAVLHGGTAIWRCYEGNRFSEDLDFYLPVKPGFEEAFRKKIEGRGLRLLKFKETENAIYSKISDGFAEVRFEALTAKKKVSAIAMGYQKTDGSQMTVFTLSAEDFILEKISAYTSRRLIRDFYDIYHLLAYVRDGQKIKQAMHEFMRKTPSPLDERNLKALVYMGAVPNYEQMREALERFSK